MSLTIFYKFVHQREQLTVHFDGTGINVFDLKHEIIAQNQLGQGLDFMLRIYQLEQPDTEYENDQDVIPRSLLVLVKRLPCQVVAGRYQNALRYVTGKPRITKFKTAVAPVAHVETVVDENVLEEDRIRQMFDNQSNVWAQAQDELANQKAVYFKPLDDLPPPGYVCYRCGGKDHWIKNCPTISDPNFEGKKIKKTTGIPKSYMKTITKEAMEYRLANPETNDTGIHTNESGDLVDDQGNLYMVTEEGDYVMTFADSKTWNTYQEKQLSAASKAKREFDETLAKRAAADGRGEFLDPLALEKVLAPPIVRTPCCDSKELLKTMPNYYYNREALEQLLIENDFHCPNCARDDVYIDQLVPCPDVEKALQAYIAQLGMADPSKRPAPLELLPEPKRMHVDYALDVQLPTGPKLALPTGPKMEMEVQLPKEPKGAVPLAPKTPSAQAPKAPLKRPRRRGGRGRKGGK